MQLDLFIGQLYLGAEHLTGDCEERWHGLVVVGDKKIGTESFGGAKFFFLFNVPGKK